MPRTRAAAEEIALYQAAILAERLPAGPAAVPADAADARAGSRLERWASQPPFDEGDWWARRLAGAGLTERALRDLLAESPTRLAARLGARPDWLTESLTAYWGDHGTGQGRSLEADGQHQADAPFAGMAEPLLARARHRLDGQVAALQAGARTPFDPRDLVDQLYRQLPRTLDRVLARTMVLELNAARLLGTLPGDTPEERFDAFCERLRQPRERRRLLTGYPVLGRLLVTITRNWVRAGRQLACRLVDDWPLLEATFAPGGELGPVTEVATDLGDPHRGGATVTAVTCAGGARLVYKPRPVRVDVHFQQLLEWVNGHGVPHPFRTLTYLDRDDHGWAELVAQRACGGPGELHRFYHRQGGLLALLYVLRGNDLCAENLVAAGEQPLLIDLEALCQPELAIGTPGAPAAERAAMDAAAASVLRVGLLPVRAWHTANGKSVDLSGLGGAPGQLSSMELAEVDGFGTDRMRFRLRRRAIDPTPNRPVGPESSLRVVDYLDDIVNGFTETYELCRRHRRELTAPDGPLDAFTGDEVRVILRSTMEYGLLRHTGYHPDVLRDGLDTERHFDRLWKGVARRPALEALVEHERRDLWEHDIPSFAVPTDGTVLRSSAGAPVSGLVSRTGMDSVRAVLDGLGPRDLTRQCWLIRASVATMSLDSQGVEYPGYPLPRPGGPADRQRLIDTVDAIGRHLAAIAYRAPDSVQWLGVISDRGESWSLGPLGADLYTGLSGLALFFGYLGALTDDRRHTALARTALGSARSQVDRQKLAKLGGGAGLGGILYVFTQLGVLWRDGSLIDEAVSLAQLGGAWAAEDEQFDFVGGSAGSIAALRALHTVRPVGPVRDAIRACAERLLAAQSRAGPGAAWLPRSMVEEAVASTPLAGFAHGAAGIAWPLLEAAELCGEERYHLAAVAAVAYERGLFLPEAGNWQDVRRDFRDADPDFSAWCHGAAGVGMARALSLPHLRDPLVRDEIVTAVRTTVRVGFGMNHSLCHGDIGNLELLVLAADALDEPSWRDRAQSIMGAILDSIDERGWITGLPRGIEAPGLLLGLAGTGYGMLRMAAPERVPSVLTFAPPPA